MRNVNWESWLKNMDTLSVGRFEGMFSGNRLRHGLAWGLVFLVSLSAIPNNAEAESPHHSAPTTNGSQADS